ncbi:MAG: transglutaminase-like domain-containing protein [Promethearchaeota archaeon]
MNYRQERLKVAKKHNRKGVLKSRTIGMLFLFSVIFWSISISIYGIVLNNYQSGLPDRSIINSSAMPMASSTSLSGGIAKGYSFGSNVTYQIEYNFTVKAQQLGVGEFEFWLGRIENISNGRYGPEPPYMVSLLELNVSNRHDIIYHYDDRDDYNNSYEFFKMHLDSFNSSTEFNYYIRYKITLREIKWNIDTTLLPNYNKSDPLYLNYTGAEPKLEVDDPVLINLSYSITNWTHATSIYDKVKSIYDWIIANMTYQLQTANNGADKGAKQAYLDRNGDCSEFSDLMVTLLRIQGIPARKVIGLSIVKEKIDKDTNHVQWEPLYDPDIGMEINYTSILNGNQAETNIPGHAWMEYYIPQYGWISCDPTWGKSGYDFLNRIDYLHLPTSFGENYGGGIDPSPNETLQEFPISPLMMFTTSLNYKLYTNFMIKITVLDKEIQYNNNLWQILIVFLVLGLISIILWSLGRRKR